MKDDFSFPLVRIDTVGVHGDVKGERSIIHVCDVVSLDFLFNALVLVVSAEDGHLFFVIVWQLL